ncbi:MAG TPA: glycosyltransferase [Chitinophagaceae bacterium]|nr:glycosyltransferase [Chitinophagaceae bacterium]
MPILSVIVPVYNEEARIEKCIRSIQNQTLKELEVIAVDDGSTDHSHEILCRLAQSDNRIKIFSFNNGGTGLALNRGLKKASGKYIGFSGADDWMEPEMFEKLIVTMEADHTDVAVCDIMKEWNNRSEPVLKLSKHELISKELLEKLILMEFDYSICNKIYRRDIITQNNIGFEENLRLSQDALFNMCVFACINSISVIPGSFYHYVAKEGSLMTSPQDKRIESFNYIVKAFGKFCTVNHKPAAWNIFEQHIGPGYQKYLFNLVLKSSYTDTLNFSGYYSHVLRHLEMMDPLLLYAPLDNLGSYQRFRKGLLQKKRFKTFSFLAAVRHKALKR